VIKYANASVLLVREKAATMTRASGIKGKTAAINRVLLATDGSKYSDVVTQFLLDLPLPRHSQVIVITALQSHLAAWMKMPTLDLQTNQELLDNLQAAEESEARKITAKAERQFQTRGYKTASVVIRGGVAESILKAAEEYEPDIIALGAKGLIMIESFLLGSVAERVARYANCSVLIGRVPRQIGEQEMEAIFSRLRDGNLHAPSSTSVRNQRLPIYEANVTEATRLLTKAECSIM